MNRKEKKKIGIIYVRVFTGAHSNTKHTQPVMSSSPTTTCYDETTVNANAGASVGDNDCSASCCSDNDGVAAAPLPSVCAPVPAPPAVSLSGVQSAFRMCASRSSKGTNVLGRDLAQMQEGATFYAVCMTDMPSSEEDFKGLDYMMLSAHIVQPISPGRAKAPHEYGRGSKKTKEQLAAFNRNGLPLCSWADSSNMELRFWGCEKKGFNRGNRVEDLTWTYGGGHTMGFCINIKDMQPREYDGAIPFFMDKRMPASASAAASSSLFPSAPPAPPPMPLAFDLARITLMPKNEDGLRKDKKQCFTLKSAGPTIRTLAGILQRLRATMCKSKDEAEQDALHLLRGDEAPYKDKRGRLLPYAHQVCGRCVGRLVCARVLIGYPNPAQVDAMPPKDDRENYAASEIVSCCFLEENLAGVTFMYADDNANTKVVRMCVQKTVAGKHVQTAYCVNMSVHSVLRNANSVDLHSACGLYTIASYCPGALCAFVAHKTFWAKTLWDADCGFGEPTPFRGALIIDASKLLAPLHRDELYLSSSSVVSGEGKKARMTVDMGFEMKCATAQQNSSHEDVAVAAAATTDEDECAVASTAAAAAASPMCKVMAEVAVLPRSVTQRSTCKLAAAAVAATCYSTSVDMPLSPHESIDLQVAYVMTVYVVMMQQQPQTQTTVRKNIMNLNYNGCRDMSVSMVDGSGGSDGGDGGGRKHVWSNDVSSVIDCVDDDGDDGSGAGADSKRFKSALNAVA